MQDRFNRFFVCLLDVLGFETRFRQFGLAGILDRYWHLISEVKSRNAWTEKWFGPMDFAEGAYHTAERRGFVSTRLYGTYASDTILLCAHADFPENRYPAALELSPEERSKRAGDPLKGWMYHTIPCDPFLDLCNEVICRSIEIGLPLRGAISFGEAVLQLDEGIYLGQPLIDAARLERPQACIGSSFSKSFMQQLVPNRYRIPHTDHFKGAPPPQFGGAVLDWPRHWRDTRTASLEDAISALDTNPMFHDYYAKTLGVIQASGLRATQFNEPEHTYLTKVYPQFSSPDVELLLRPFVFERVESESPDTPPEPVRKKGKKKGKKEEKRGQAPMALP